MAWAAGTDQPSQPTTDPTTQAAVTLINIHLEQTLPEAVFDELAKQSGIKFSPSGKLWEMDGMQTPMDVDFTNRPFGRRSRRHPPNGGWGFSPPGADLADAASR